MKITFISNFLNHHQIEFCKEMISYPNIDFKFVATTPVPQERLDLGYSNMNDDFEFVVKSYESNDQFEYAIELSINSDVVIVGSAPSVYTKERLSQNKLTFRYMERLLKGGRHKILKPRTLASMIVNHTRYRNKKVYLLCASAYTYSDFSLVGAYKNKAYKWGYFPKFYEYDITTLYGRKSNDLINILWVGRFLELKDPLISINLVKQLVSEGRTDIHLTFIGEGPMFAKMNHLIKINNLNKFITILPPLSPEKVREHMLDSDVFLFTSNLHEGWGAVLNEAMNSGCAVIASHAIGSVPFLIENGKNGLIYKSGSLNSLKECVNILLNDTNRMKSLGFEAYSTISRSWNARNATQQLINLFNALLKSRNYKVNEGPISKANIISDRYKNKEVL